LEAEIISVGTELLLGDIIDTNAAYLSKVLSEIGVDLKRRVTVGDNEERIRLAVVEALSRADVVIIIGGLGPTEDDITKEASAAAIRVELLPDEESARPTVWPASTRARTVSTTSSGVEGAASTLRTVLGRVCIKCTSFWKRCAMWIRL